MEQTEYPIQLSVEYPDRPLDRLTTAFRIFVGSRLIVFGAVLGGTWQTADDGGSTGISSCSGSVIESASTSP
jgi:hypothetical protein